MYRDKGPIHNLGYGVSSRELPSREGETETPSPNSGYIAKALDGHPVMRFFASTATAMVVTMAASSVLKKGGLRLSKYLQDSADAAQRAGRTDAMPSRLIRSITDIRKTLDEYQSVYRQIDGVDDPYSRIVYDVEGKLTSGYDGKSSERYFFGQPISRQGARTNNRGLTSESAELFTAKDELQKRLIRAGRRMPYELPALYIVQKGITENLFGGEQNQSRKVNWYNPADVISDFVQSSVVNVATMILPFEAVGAAGAAGRSSLTTLATSMSDLRGLSPVQSRAANAAIDLRSLMGEVGQDLTKITSAMLKVSSQTSGAFSSAVNEAANAQPEFVQAWRSAMHGQAEAARKAANRNEKYNFVRTSTARVRGFFLGAEEAEHGFIDTLPGFKGTSVGVKAFRNNFKALGVAHDVVSGRMTRDDALSLITQKFNLSTGDIQQSAEDLTRQLLRLKGLDTTDPKKILDDAIGKIQSLHSSRLTGLARSYDVLGAGGPDTERFKSSFFYQSQLRDEYKNQLATRLVSRGASQEAADSFVAQININQLPKASSTANNVAQRITIGRKAAYDDLEGATKEEANAFFDNVLERFRQVKKRKRF